jgi:hypothetical protein
MLRTSILLLIATFTLVINSAAQGDDNNNPPAKAFLELRASKTQLKPGECTVIRFSFNVYDDNRARIHFYELAEQLGKLSSLFNIPGVYFVPSRIDSIYGEKASINGKGFLRYTIHEKGICPIAPGDITIPSLTVKMKHITRVTYDTTLVDYKTKAVTLHVGSVPPGIASQVKSTGIPVAGNYRFTEGWRPEKVNVGEAFKYSIFIDGKGNTASLFPSRINREKFEVDLIASESTDYIEHDTIYGGKALTFQILPKAGTEGTFKVSSIIEPIAYYNPVKKSMDMIVPEQSVIVTNNTVDTPKPERFPSDSTKTFIFLVDISTSMQVEDFNPNRLNYLKRQIADLISKGYAIEPIVFSAFAAPLSTRTRKREVSEIDYSLIKGRGTAVGDAILYAIQYIKTSGRNYSNKIFIAGDGDGTMESIPASMAGDYAKLNGFSICSVGVGTPGPAPFGTDAAGKKHIVYDTFSEKDLKILATKTNGRYVRLLPDGSLLTLLKPELLKP